MHGETPLGLLIGLEQETLFAWGTGYMVARGEWATFLLQQGASCPGWARWGKGHYNDV